MVIAEGDATGIFVRTKIFFLAFLLLLFKTNVSINGVTTVLKWGENFFAVPTGQHEVRVSFRYLFSDHMGEAAVRVDVTAGRTTTVLYRSPLVVFMKGSIKVVEA